MPSLGPTVAYRVGLHQISMLYYCRVCVCGGGSGQPKKTPKYATATPHRATPTPIPTPPHIYLHGWPLGFGVRPPPPFGKSCIRPWGKNRQATKKKRKKRASARKSRKTP